MSRRYRMAVHPEDLAPRSFRVLPHIVARASMTDATRGLRFLLRSAQIGLPRRPKSKPE